MNPVTSVLPLCLAADHPVTRPARFHLKGLLAVVLGLLALSAYAQPADLEVDVRSKVTDGMPQWDKEKTLADGGHGMIYGILAIKEIKNVELMLKPLDEKRVVSILMDTLDANGFREFLPGEEPDILITASYGRGELSNPYIRDTGTVSGAQGLPSPTSTPALPQDSQPAGGGASSFPSSGPGSVDNAPPSQTITGADARQLFDEKGPGYEAKLQKAGYEKLFIRITGWEYPSGPKAKPKMLWKTIMVVDDPDHRDLNVVAAAMLAAGGPFFDKVPKDHEVEVHKPLPDGRVTVGVPVVREPIKPNAGK